MILDICPSLLSVPFPFAHSCKKTMWKEFVGGTWSHPLTDALFRGHRPSKPMGFLNIWHAACVSSCILNTVVFLHFLLLDACLKANLIVHNAKQDCRVDQMYKRHGGHSLSEVKMREYPGSIWSHPFARREHQVRSAKREGERLFSRRVRGR